MSVHHPAFELSCILSDLPEELQDQPVMPAIRDAFRYGYANRLWSKLEAGRLACRANLARAINYGAGHKAKRRIHHIAFIETMEL